MGTAVFPFERQTKIPKVVLSLQSFGEVTLSVRVQRICQRSQIDLNWISLGICSNHGFKDSCNWTSSTSHGDYPFHWTYVSFWQQSVKKNEKIRIDVLFIFLPKVSRGQSCAL